ncbi:MAG: hypothetical protein DMF53_09230 [Acidobacteria bacterium]|nr:MAG: hypothetical protein DMF53_09230 [Acidobacteriota bacterium]
MSELSESWTIYTSNENNILVDDTLVFESTDTLAGIVRVGGIEWGSWTGSAFPPSIVTHDGQPYCLQFDPATASTREKVTCSLDVASSGKGSAPETPGFEGSEETQCSEVPWEIPCGEVQGSSGAALGGSG